MTNQRSFAWEFAAWSVNGNVLRYVYGGLLHRETITSAVPRFDLCDMQETSNEFWGFNCSKNGETVNKEPEAWTEEEKSLYRLFRSIY